MTRWSQISIMEGGVSRIISARAGTVTGTRAYAWEDAKIKLAINSPTVTQGYTVSTTLTHRSLRASLSSLRAKSALTTWIARIRWDAQELT